MENSLLSAETFIRDYERNVAAGNMPAAFAQFADPFLAAVPQGAKIMPVADFAQGLPARKQLFDRMGCESSSLANLHPIPLSARYTLVLTKWRMTFAVAQSSAKEILVDSAFIVDTGGAEMKIILYLAADDIMALMKQRGIAQD
jgi:hypothetical protein